MPWFLNVCHGQGMESPGLACIGVMANHHMPIGLAKQQLFTFAMVTCLVFLDSMDSLYLAFKFQTNRHQWVGKQGSLIDVYEFDFCIASIFLFADKTCDLSSNT